MFETYNHLGFNNPFYFVNDGKFEIHKTFPETIQKYPNKKEVDPVAVIELLNNNFILGDRTLIKEVYHTPWMAKPNVLNNEWVFDKLPEHGELNIPEEEIAKTLFRKICDEIKFYVGNKKKVGILLSGGMDSRMAAGALDFLIKQKQLSQIEVTALTWGDKGTRDVVYAKEISTRLGWKWKQYEVTAQKLWENIHETATNGCNYSPIDLHGIPQIRDDNKDLEIIIAGSYGDSIGRAEYFGWKLKNAPAINNKFKNLSHLVLDKTFKENVNLISNDIDNYHNLFPTNNTIAKKEYDLQLHYMRKMLNPCISLLDNETTKFHQVFTSPDVYGFMWGISLNQRSDNVYKFMLKLFETHLDDIPWARTGLQYGDKNGIPDKYKKNHHSYASLIRNELLNKIESTINSSKLFELNIFNKKSVTQIIKLEQKYNTNNLLFLDKLSWLTALAIMIDKYGIEIPIEKYSTQNHTQQIKYSFWKNILRKKYGPIIKKIIQS